MGHDGWIGLEDEGSLGLNDKSSQFETRAIPRNSKNSRVKWMKGWKKKNVVQFMFSSLAAYLEIESVKFASNFITAKCFSFN